MSLVSINLLTYNASRFIEKCLRSVFGQTYDRIEVLIIDNASQDETMVLAQKIISQENSKFPVRIIKNEKNLGFAAGHNLGIKESKGELILCLNQDVVLEPDFVQKAVDFFEKNKDKKIGALQAKLLRLDKKLEKTDTIDTTGFVIFKNRRIVNRGQGEKDGGQYDLGNEIFGADGAAPVYARKALEDVKITPTLILPLKKGEGKEGDGEYFDEDFFMYKEDVDLAWRLRLAGWQSFYVPQMVAGHQRGAGESAATNYLEIVKERKKIGKFAKYLAFKNQRLMQIKNEQLGLLLKHLPWFLPKEIASWIYVILFERYTLKAIKDLFFQAPKAFGKRKIIMASKRINAAKMAKWFH